MSKIHGMMDIGRRSMMNSQTALSTSGHNISNQGVEGYSRQRVEIVTNEPVNYGSLRMGTGSRAAKITRINNPYLEKQIGKEQSTLGFYQGRADGLNRVEQVFNEQNGKGLNHTLSEFFNSFREFSNNPESLATRTNVRETADVLVKDFKRVNKQMKEIQKDIDNQIAIHVEEINGYTKEIASLNEKIHMVEVAGSPANDERDRRDLLLKKLGEKINVKWAEGDNGQVNVTAGNSILLVGGIESRDLEVRQTEGRDNKREMNVDIFVKNSVPALTFRATDQITGGAVGGLIETRDKTINGILQQVDELALGLVSRVNQVHREGYDIYNRSGSNFFAADYDAYDLSERIDLSADIRGDVGRISAAEAPYSPGDNRVANRIGALQYQPVGETSSASLDEYFNSIVGEVGVQTRRATETHKTQSEIVKQLGNLRESISGVSLDEEATKLIEFQKAFDASARLIRTADEMFDTVLNLKRL